MRCVSSRRLGPPAAAAAPHGRRSSSASGTPVRRSRRRRPRRYFKTSEDFVAAEGVRHVSVRRGKRVEVRAGRAPWAEGWQTFDRAGLVRGLFAALCNNQSVCGDLVFQVSGVPIGGCMNRQSLSVVLARREREWCSLARRRCVAALRYVDDLLLVSSTDCLSCLDRRVRELYGGLFTMSGHGGHGWCTWLDMDLHAASDGVFFRHKNDNRGWLSGVSPAGARPRGTILVWPGASGGVRRRRWGARKARGAGGVDGVAAEGCGVVVLGGRRRIRALGISMGSRACGDAPRRAQLPSGGSGATCRARGTARGPGGWHGQQASSARGLRGRPRRRAAQPPAHPAAAVLELIELGVPRPRARPHPRLGFVCGVRTLGGGAKPRQLGGATQKANYQPNTSTFGETKVHIVLGHIHVPSRLRRRNGAFCITFASRQLVRSPNRRRSPSQSLVLSLHCMPGGSLSNGRRARAGVSTKTCSHNILRHARISIAPESFHHRYSGVVRVHADLGAERSHWAPPKFVLKLMCCTNYWAHLQPM